MRSEENLSILRGGFSCRSCDPSSGPGYTVSTDDTYYLNTTCIDGWLCVGGSVWEWDV